MATWMSSDTDNNIKILEIKIQFDQEMSKSSYQTIERLNKSCGKEKSSKFRSKFKNISSI